MTVYTSQNPNSAIHSYEFIAGEEHAFFHLKPGHDPKPFVEWLSQTAGQQIVSQSINGPDPVIVTRGDRGPAELLALLQQRGEALEAPAPEKKKFDPWKWRGITSLVGQSLQLTSSWGSSHGPDRIAIAGFALSNLAANGSNIAFGSQKKKDPHQLRLLKDHFNQLYAPYLGPETHLPNPDDTRLKLRPSDERHRTVGSRLYELGQRYSVSGGEIGLRVFGSASLAFPVTQWAEGAREFGKTKSPSRLLEVVRNKQNPITYKVGLMMLVGKFVSFCSIEPDPYNPNPPSALHKFREKVTFPLSSLIEGGAAGWMAYDRYFNQKMKFGTHEFKRDYLGALGNLVFIGGYGIRLFATYGTREVDMRELNSHLSDGLARVPRDKLPELLSETAQQLERHFKGKKETFADYYAGIARDLREFHGIDINAPQMFAADQEKPKTPHTRVHRNAQAQGTVGTAPAAALGVGAS